MPEMVHAGRRPQRRSVRRHPSGKWLSVVNSMSNDVSIFAIDPVTGALGTPTTATAAVLPTSITLDPTGQFAYVTHVIGGTVWSYGVDPLTGALTPTGDAFAGKGPYAMAIAVVPH